jgi:hypothetical protein
MGDRTTNLEEIFARGKPAPDVPEEEKYDKPDPSNYKAFGTPRNHLTCLQVYLGAEGRKRLGKKKLQFQYVQIDSDDKDGGFSEDGTFFSVVFVGSVKQRLTVRGRNLETGYDQLTFHRMPWIRAADRDGGDDGEPVITGIEVEDVTPKE